MFELLTDKSIIFEILYIVGISSESISGTISSTRKNMDLFGISTVAIITALGGGTVRDILLNNYPMIWILHPEYILITLTASMCSIFIIKHIIKLYRLFLIFDALGLVTFAYLGSDIGYRIALYTIHSNDFLIPGTIIISIVMAIITGVSGGVLRDILCNDIPLIFQTELYATIAAFVGILNALSIYFQLDSIIIILTIILTGLFMRLIAIFYNLNLPKSIFFK